ncbi:hypothetical protein ACGFS9_20235 [Streptomyces sp. NPDC048566]|uniref:hypothetical protein n=1 Tax=Streptomyces sp. NPDC048566 TaxID=3365569 RepID=UPI003723151E
MFSASSAAGGAPPHVRELAQFLAVCEGRGPAMLWPEQDHARHGRDVAARARESRELARLTGLHPSLACHVADVEGPHRSSAGSTDRLLVQQIDGAGTFLLPVGQVGEPPFTCRLRSGEVLYVPPGRSWRADLTPGARLLLISLAPGRPHDHHPG